MGVPELARHAETIHRQEHLLDFRPVPLQRHRIAPRGPAVAEADHGPDIGEAERRVDHRQREQHILAGVHGVVLFENAVGGNAAPDHRILDQRTFGGLSSRCDPAADDGVTEIALLPQPRGRGRAQLLLDPRAEHEQEVGGTQRRVGEVPRRDRHDLGVVGHAQRAISHHCPLCPLRRAAHSRMAQRHRAVTFDDPG